MRRLPRQERLPQATCAALAAQVAAYDLRAVREDVLEPVYEQLVGAGTRHGLGEYHTPGWLAGEVVEAALDPWTAAGRRPRMPGAGMVRRVLGRHG